MGARSPAANLRGFFTLHAWQTACRFVANDRVDMEHPTRFPLGTVHGRV